MEKIRMGISACLLGEKVRFDGGHKLSHYAAHDLAGFFEFVPTCPEMAIGMGAPRPTIRLVNEEGQLRVKTSDHQSDYTEALNQYSQKRVGELSDLGGYLLCAKSPTCGMERVPVYAKQGHPPEKSGVGVFAQQLMTRYPELPVEETGRLHDMTIRENFFTRVFAYDAFRQARGSGWTHQGLTHFHAQHKYLLMAHHPESYRRLGPMLAKKTDDPEALAMAYFRGFMAVLKVPATRGGHTNVLQHIQGYFKRDISKEDKAELDQAIDEYRRGMQPLLVPITLIKHHLMRHPQPYIQHQVYLNPHPQGLKLRYAF